MAAKVAWFLLESPERQADLETKWEDQISSTMPRKSPPKPDEKPQFERFLEAAKNSGADNTDEALSDAIKKIANAKPNTLKPPSEKPGRTR